MRLVSSLAGRVRGWHIVLLLLLALPAISAWRPESGAGLDPLPTVELTEASASIWTQIAAIVLATFAAEDLTCIAVGLLVGAGRLDALVGLFACWLGIFLGDVGLWALGRFAGQGLERLPWTRRWFPLARIEAARLWFDDKGWLAVLAARFIPGTRLPLYVAAGVVGQGAGRFMFWTAVAGMAWTPLLLFSVAYLGDVVLEPLRSALVIDWPLYALGALAASIGLRVLLRLTTPRGRSQLVAAVARVWRWEFWPSWLFYLPLLPWLAYLSVRYRGLTTWTAANPGIPEGGVVGESKAAILEKLAARWVVPTLLVPPGEPSERLRALRQNIAQRGWRFPLIFKPDAAQRGAGLKLVRDLIEAEKYLQDQSAAVVVQTYHPGPFEAGIFYYRLPGAATGQIFSITQKVFPVLIGDGQATVEELIWRHPRYRLQAGVFLARHYGECERVLATGERFPLAVAGNHCQGTMFRDGSHLITPELERRVDAIARHFEGFFIGRFDVRYADKEAFRAGQDLAIVELNGATSESTNLYDPSWSLWRAYRTLFRQWALLYRIGHLNRQRAAPATGAWRLVQLVLGYYWNRRVELLAD